MSELHSGEPEPEAQRVFKDIKRIELSEGTTFEQGHDRISTTERARGMGRRVAKIVDIANVLSPPPPERLADE